MANFNLNKVIIGGRLTADPELRNTNSGVATATFSIAVNGVGKDAEPDFFDAVAWRSKAEFIAKYFKKGSSICVTGSLKNRSWVDANGNKQRRTEIQVDEVMFVDSKADIAEDKPTVEEPVPEEAPKAKRTRKTKAVEAPAMEDDNSTDDLPF